jgi:hypothetical protein
MATIKWTKTSHELRANGVIVPRFDWRLPMALGAPRRWFDDDAPNEDEIEVEIPLVWEAHPGNAVRGGAALTINGADWCPGQFDGGAEDARASAQALGCQDSVLADWAEYRVFAAEDRRKINAQVGAYWSEVL